MSGRGKKAGLSRPSAAAAPSTTHRFQDRRQERMRGAGTQIAIQRDFQFKLPPSSSTRPSAPAASTPSSSRAKGRAPDAEATDKPRSSPRRASSSRANISQGDISGSVGVARRVARPPPPISSTPAASRTLPHTRRSPLFRGASDEDEDAGSQLDEEEEPRFDHDNEPFVQHDDEYSAPPHLDTSLPMIPSPSSTPGTVRRMRPSLAASSVGNLTLGDSEAYEHSPSSRAADRNTDARKRKRQSSPGAAQPRKRAPTAAAARTAAKPRSTAGTARARAVVSVPVAYDEDDSLQDRTLMEQQQQRRRVTGDTSARARGPHVSAVQGRELQKRLKRALTLVFSPSDVADLPAEGADESITTTTTKKRKSRKYLNDVDVLWSIVDEELRVAIEEQPAKAPFLALKSLRKSVRANFLALSEKTDNRTTLISHLVRARNHKRTLRKQVFATRSELAKLTITAHDRQHELQAWTREVDEVRKVNSFLENLREMSTAWT